MPLCNQSLLPVVQEHLHDLDYEEKIKVYDENCNGCGFARIIVHLEANNQKDFHTNRIEEAVHIARKTEGLIIRQCVYPQDMQEVFGKLKPISLNEIISNTCVFWNIPKVDAYSREDTEFIEPKTEEEIDARISEIPECGHI